MNLLTKEELLDLQIVRRSDQPNCVVTDGFRGTTYDSCVGRIITKKGEHAEDTYTLKPRGIVWLISSTRFRMPSNVTGLTTLRTSWTRQGVLTLTVGIVDPGYDGPLTTAVINFGKDDFCIQKGEPFFRTAFFSHAEVEAEIRDESIENYVKSVKADRTKFSESFLTIDSLAAELVPKMWALPRWGLGLGVLAFMLALLGLIIPPVVGLSKEVVFKNQKIELLEERIEKLEKHN